LRHHMSKPLAKILIIPQFGLYRATMPRQINGIDCIAKVYISLSQWHHVELATRHTVENKYSFVCGSIAFVPAYPLSCLFLAAKHMAQLLQCWDSLMLHNDPLL